ncbi:HAD family hydrolase [Cyanobium sp. CH-040]|uniref:HAD family hydrolase n=1 Tax=Cyanobium sp. CH-040 TaxID=2823708 RepID=UPI0020CE3B69|nr:HAD family hydrolase [Cyanobium sp. CH-040]MCP9927079.1 glycosyltransferase [Cyanobium sp. CH-040]
MDSSPQAGLYVLHLHLHGLFRSRDLELGRDPDTGGQTTYVLELARALAGRPEVERVDVVTRLIRDRRVSADYARQEERIGPGATILRIPFGPPRYVRKELLWPHLDELADALAERLLAQPRRPDWIHAHYADAGYVGALLQRRLGISLVFTGHSLGREKRRRLLAAGLEAVQIDGQYAMAQRIDAEELALAHAALVVTSTPQEGEQQYARYGRFRAERARVIPPGVDSRQFFPPQNGERETAVQALMEPFLRDPAKPPVLAICRADRRKNIPALVEVFGRSEHLRRHHNLVLVLGCRDDPRQLDRQQREVFQQVFELVDRFDLYGHIAYPKQHQRSQIPEIYRWAARLGGVFVNPALTEPFGLTLLEAAASGLPVVATDDGGPRDILGRCENGLLVDVSDLDALQKAVEDALAEPRRWRRWRDNGIEAVSRYFSWDAHATRYLGEALAATRAAARQRPPHWFLEAVGEEVEPEIPRVPERLLVLDLDVSLASPDEGSLAELRHRLTADPELGIGVVSGRGFAAARLRYAELHLPRPCVWITEAGTEIHYSSASADWLDRHWQAHIGRQWDRQGVEAAMAELEPRLRRQPEADQGVFKVSYALSEPDQGILPLVRQTLRHHGLMARPHLFQHWFLDVLPLAASKTEALRYVALRWQLPLASLLVEASQQGDGDLLRGLILGVVPGDHDPSLDRLRGHRRVFFSRRPQAWGLLEGLDHHRFLRR